MEIWKYGNILVTTTTSNAMTIAHTDVIRHFQDISLSRFPPTHHRFIAAESNDAHIIDKQQSRASMFAMNARALEKEGS